MKIVLVSDAIYPYNKGGKEKRLYELSTRLARLGNDVHIYTMHWWSSDEQKRSENGVTLHAISKYYPMYKGTTRSIKQGVIFGIACLRLRHVSWDVLDVDHMPFFPIYSAWMVCRWNALRGRPAQLRRFYGTWHEALSRKDWTDYMGPLGIVSYVIEHFSIKLPDYITAASQHTARGLASKHRRTRNVEVVPNGIDTGLIAKVSPAKRGFDILYVGRLVKGKNADKLIGAIDLLRRDFPDVRCAIIGHGIEYDNLANQIMHMSLGENIRLLDPLPQDTDVYGVMKAARVYCLPSAREGFGMTVLEALGCGTPVVTVDSEANASKDLVEDGRAGSVVPLKTDALADALAKWLKKPKPKNIADGVRGYDWDVLSGRMAEVYAR